MEAITAVLLLSIALAPIVHTLAIPKSSSISTDYSILNAARDKMEDVSAKDFYSIPVGTSFSDTVTIGGKVVQRDVTVILYDVNGDLAPEEDAKRITVKVEETQLEALKVGT